MAKRGNGEGSIFQTKTGVWAAAISVRIDGKRMRRVAYAPTRRKAADKLKILLDKSARGIAGRRDETLGDYLARWLDIIRPEIKPRSHAKFEAVVRLHVQPRLGTAKLEKLTGLQIQELINAKARAGMAPQSVLHLRNTLRNALNRAIRLGLIDRNPAAHVEVPRLPQTRVQPLSPAQAERLLEAARTSRLEAFYVLALATGARRGELLGLKWTDVDLDNSRLTIRRALQRIEGQQGLQLTETKSATANRTIILPKFAIAALKAHRARQLQERLISGPDWRNDGFVFTGRDGQPLEPITLHRDFKALLNRAGLPVTTRVHDLRHGAATLLLAKGVPLKLIQNLLGHSSIAVTSAFYAHVADELKQTAADAMDSMFNR
jgi:integrase